MDLAMMILLVVDALLLIGVIVSCFISKKNRKDTKSENKVSDNIHIENSDIKSEISTIEPEEKEEDEKESSLEKPSEEKNNLEENNSESVNDETSVTPDEIVSDTAQDKIDDSISEEVAVTDSLSEDKEEINENVNQNDLEKVEDKTDEIVSDKVDEKTSDEINDEVNEKANDEVTTDNSKEIKESALKPNETGFLGLKHSSLHQKSFSEKILESEDRTKEYYNQIRNQFKSYKGINARVSKKCDSFRKGRELIAKIMFAGKTMKIYFKLNPNNFDVKVYHHKNIGDKKTYRETPMLIKVRSDKAYKNAINLIDEMMLSLEVSPKMRYTDVDFIEYLKTLQHFE